MCSGRTIVDIAMVGQSAAGRIIGQPCEAIGKTHQTEADTKVVVNELFYHLLGHLDSASHTARIGSVLIV